MVSLAVFAILVGIVVPSFVNYIRDSRRTALVNDLVAYCQYARSEALKRGTVVTLCASANGSSCAGSGSSWSSGWIVFVNPNDGGNTPVVDSGETILKYFTNDSSSNAVSAPVRGFSFRPYNSQSTSSTLTVCDARGASAARAVLVQLSGRAYASTTDLAGGALSCS